MNRPDYNTTLQAWADIVIDIWEDKVVAMNIQGNALLESFTNHVVLNSNGTLKVKSPGTGRGKITSTKRVIRSIFS